MQLEPELVPEPLWTLSAYRILSRAEWERIGEHTFAEANDTCAACQTHVPGGSMECDETWSYDEGAGIATLVGFRALCSGCNLARHFGWARALGLGDQARDRLAAVNGISKEEAGRLEAEARIRWKPRSGRSWVVHVGSSLVERYPSLAALEGLEGHPGGGTTRHEGL